MKSLIKIFVIALLGAATFVSCLSDDVTSESCNYSIQNPVIEVTGPETATVGQQVTFNIKFNSGNGCYTSSEFSETGTNPKTITVNSTYIGCVCTEATQVITKEYKFTPTASGEYQFKFLGNNNTFITKTITVTQ